MLLRILIPVSVLSIIFAILVDIFISVSVVCQCLKPYKSYSAVMSAASAPNYDKDADPCYYKWKQEEEEKLNEAFRRRDESQRQQLENSRRDRELQIRQNLLDSVMEVPEIRNYENKRRTAEKLTGDGKTQNSLIALGAIFGVIFAICGCCGCYAWCNDDKQKPIGNVSRIEAPSSPLPLGLAYILPGEIDYLTSEIRNARPQRSPSPRPLIRNTSPVFPETRAYIPVAVEINIPPDNIDDTDDPPSYAEAMKIPSALFST